MKIKSIIFTSIIILLPALCLSKISIEGGLTNERIVSVADSYSGAIIIRNNGTELTEVKLYQTDYLFYSDGTNQYAEPGSIKRSNADWITFSPPRLTIPPSENARVNYTINVPSDEMLIGTYWSILMVEEVPLSSLELNPEEEEVGITQVLRYAIQMISNIGDTGNRMIQFINTKVIQESNRRVLQINIENTGETILRPKVWTEFYNSEGQHVGTYEAQTKRTYPGTSIRHEIDISTVPNGAYKAIIVADCGDDALFGINYTLQIDDDPALQNENVD
ncbi:hypothetical protein HQ585_04010 [candidate division KSB1 bacterium]|nr:hypothetical protein [candidate division KSB1 bacterium]